MHPFYLKRQKEAEKIVLLGQVHESKLPCALYILHVYRVLSANLYRLVLCAQRLSELMHPSTELVFGSTRPFGARVVRNSTIRSTQKVATRNNFWPPYFFIYLRKCPASHVFCTPNVEVWWECKDMDEMISQIVVKITSTSSVSVFTSHPDWKHTFSFSHYSVFTSTRWRNGKYATCAESTLYTRSTLLISSRVLCSLHNFPRGDNMMDRNSIITYKHTDIPT